MAQVPNGGQLLDVVLVHGPAEARWAGYLDARLRAAGLSTHLPAADRRPGDDITATVDRVLARARTGVILIGETTPDTLAEYSALIRLADEGRLRLIPVILASAPIPPLLNRFEPVNLIGVRAEKDVDACLPRLLAAIRDAPGRDTGWTPPPLLFDQLPEGPVTVTLRVTETAMTLSSPAGVIVSAPSRDIVTRSGDPLRAGRRHRDLGGDGTPAEDHRITVAGPVGGALAEAVAASRRRGSPLRIGVEIAPGSPLNDLRWEGLRAPGEDSPLALLPHVTLFRSVPDLGDTVIPHIAGPLRILAVIASPDHDGGPLLDYEHELATILEQVEAARRAKAYVRILNWGSADAIREALTEERFHVLHVSCHAEPGRLVLERPDGAADLIDAAGFVRQVLVPGRMVPLVVLAGCSTARAGQDALPSFAQTLLAHGVPAVLAMTAPINDLYATQLLARTYRGLLTDPDPLPALSDARRICEQERLRLPVTDPRREVVEWTVPALFTRVAALRLYDPAAPGPVRRTAGPRIDRKISRLSIGDFVGRRRELRTLMTVMSRPTGGGVVIHGMGGVGKSTLAVAALREIAPEGYTVITTHGPQTPAGILGLIARAVGRSPGADAVTLDALADEESTWQERLEPVEDLLLDGHRIVLLLDDPLGDPLGGLAPGQTFADAESVPRADGDLLDFLDRWLDLDGALVVVTLRMAESLRGLPAPDRLTRLHLGELSPAETRKLLWRLPWVYALDSADRDRAYREIGGHPRCLEYLNALLGAGRGEPAPDSRARVSEQRGAFRTVSERLMRALDARGVDRPGPAARQSLGTALDTAIATSAAEVLLGELYHRLDGDPAQRLLVAASVFRVPVDDTGLNWMLATDPPPDPARVARLRAVYDRLRREPGVTLDRLPLPPAEREQLNRDLLGSTYPAREKALDQARRTLLDLSLLSPADGGDLFLVHRWTAGSLTGLAGPAALAEAHRRAAAFHRWHGEHYEPDADFTDLREAHHHAWAAGDEETAVVAAAELCALLHSRGAYDEEWVLCDRTLARLDPDNPQTAVFLHAKALIAEVRGDYDTAVDLQKRCLDLAGAAGDTAGLATGRQQLGVIAQLRGDAAGAEEAYRAAMRICFGLDLDASPRAEAVLAACYQQLGALALERGDPDGAARWSIGALEMIDRLGDSAEAGDPDDDLARLALACGDEALADQHQLASWELRATRPDIQRLAATAALQLGAVHVLNDRPGAAGEELGRAAERAAGLGDRPLLARCLQLQGDVLFELHHSDEAAAAYRAQLDLLDEIDGRTDLIVVYQQLGRVCAARGDLAGAAGWFDDALALARRHGIDRLVAATHLYRGTAAIGGPAEARLALTACLEAADTAGDDTLWISAQLGLAAADAQSGPVTADARPGPASADARPGPVSADAQDGPAVADPGAGPAAADDAVSRADQALGRALRSGNESAVVACCVVHGLLAREDNDDDTAIGWFRQAQARAAAIGHRRVIADCHLHLGRIEADRRDPDRAEEHFRACLAGTDPDRHADLIWSAWRELGRVRAGRDDHEGALAALDEALTMVTGTDQPGLELWCLIRLLWSRERTGDTEGVRAAAQRCAEIATALPPSPYAAVGLLCAGDGLARGDDPETVRELYETAQSIARECGRPAAPLAVDATWQLGRMAAGAGEHSAAIERFQLMLGIAGLIGDRFAATHALREIGRAVRDSGDLAAARGWLLDAWRAARPLGDPRLVAATQLLLADVEEAGGDPERAAGLRAAVAERFPSRATARRRADHHPLYVSMTRAWHHLQWSRRLATADGETPFVQAQARYLGPSADHVIREMASRASLVQGVPAAVAPLPGRRKRSR
ncbi:CHAT domain-containing protein [Actinoplanes sp. G11-F43]|uniref:CHAT domain-containing protein n=1 Tax=Actinoplanes sp. G11-F43 TaxID=3424130 RepID=UPI003D351209